ncbi:unnamed protein product [Arctia plantaginis]|nr:unnamed protein product [Arctia plantaginis]
MGSSHSIRSTHFQRPTKDANVESIAEEEFDDQRSISITNKMVERLVEDATLAGGAAPAALPPKPKVEYRDKIYSEKLKCMDDNHSERCRITMDDLNAMANRIELRTSNMVSVEPVCVDFKKKIIECYNENEPVSETVKCWDAVGDFTKCVSEAAGTRLRARTQREAREHARRTRHVAHAREHALKDLGPTSVLD